MNFGKLVALVADLPFFDLATLVQLTDERRSTLLVQLHRLVKAGKLVPLRRGLYVLGETYRKRPVVPAELANAIYRPSYLSDRWALSFHGAIPEQTAVFTSVTSRAPKRFDTALGEFAYRHVKPSLLFGFAPVEVAGRKVLIASAEKALVDHWHLHHGEWTEQRVAALRPDPAALDDERLVAIVARIAKPRLRRALDAWSAVRDELCDGEVAL
jgi:predicted transcriptional regulator of viral defense system